MASLFLSYALGCDTMLLIAAWKRSQHRRRSADEAAQQRELLRLAPTQFAEVPSEFSRRNMATNKGWNWD